jgi:hypothetical protein
MKLKHLVALGLTTIISISWLVTNVFAAENPVTKLEISDFPETVESFADFSFKIKALDDNDNPVNDYTGTVIFSSETDSNAELPSEYKFELSDQGVHEFTESYYFTGDGPQKLTVTDKSNPTLKDTITINVSDEEQASNTEVTIDSPTAGSTTNPIITIRGSAPAKSTVTILNGTETLGTTESDNLGSYSFDTPVLQDGTYNLQAEVENLKSEKVTVIINTKAPNVDFIELSPKEVTSEQSFSLQIRLKSDARDVKVLLGGFQTSLVRDENSSRLFTGSLKAPSIPGNYEIKLKIEDNLGNIADNIGTDEILVVLAGQGQSVNSTSFNVPSQVTGFAATVADRRVNLTWIPAQAQNGIKNYEIRYGVNPADLNLKVETLNSQNNWYIPNLINGQTYFFQVFAIDTLNQKSDLGSEIIAANPNPTGLTTIHGSAPGQVLVNQATNTGPGGIMVLAGFALAGAVGVVRRRG